MKQKQLSILAASLIAAFAVNVAYAGNVASSNPQIAREVITADTQDVLAPEASYAFQGDLNTASQIQTMQVQITLTAGGAWDKDFVTAGSIQLFEADGVTAIAPVLPVTPTVSADGKTLFATLTYAVDGVVHKNPVLSFNRVGTQSNLFKLFSVVGTVASCDKTATQLPFTVKHFTGVAPGSVELAKNGVNGAFEDESARAAANNNNVLMSFPTNLGLSIVPSTGAAKVDPANQLQFKAPLAPDATTQSVTLANIGSIALKQQANGYDSNLADVYDITGVVAGDATADVQNGPVEASALNVTVTATQGFVPGGTVFLSTAADCSAPIAGTTTAITALTGNSLSFSVATANLAGILANPLAVAAAPFPAFAAQTAHVCYNVAGATTAIPPSVFAGTATLVKAAGALPFPEQNNSCAGPLFPLASGVKIDVRNYSTSKNNSGWQSVVRIINPSETSPATVYGQIIHADGSYGGWGVLAQTLAPRAVVNLPSTAIDAKLTNAPVSNGAGYVAGTVAPVAAEVGDRLRITADGVGSLRVQNYLYNQVSQMMVEASGTQAVDFDGSDDRAPVNEGQYQSQDAQRGIAK